MFSTIEKNLKTLESTKTSLKTKLAAYERAKKEIGKLEKLFEELSNIDLFDTDSIDYNNIDEKLSSLQSTLENDTDISSLILIKKDILSCKAFLEAESQVKITVNDMGDITDISDQIKENLLINQIIDD